MKESLATFRKAVNESADLQEKIKGGTDLVELGKENGHDFSAEDVTAAYEELQDSDEELTEFELESVSGGSHFGPRGRYRHSYCWVAREVYGEANPQWLLFRRWLLGDSPNWFRNLYISRGKAFANWLSNNAWLKPMIRCWMDSRIRIRS